MPRLSILIAHEGDAAALETTLVSVLEHRPADCEILVAHDGAYTDPYELSDEVRFVTLPPGTRVDQSLAAAVLQARGELLHLLGAGGQVEEDWAEDAVQCFDDETIGAVCPLQRTGQQGEDAQAVGVRLTWGGARKVVSQRKVKTIAGPSRHAAFYRRDAVMAVGGWPTAVGPDLADVDIASSLHRAGVQTAVAEESIVTFVTQPATATCGAFGRGYFGERLYWRHAKERGVAKTMLAHIGHCLVATFAAMPLAWVAGSTGRTWGLLRAMLAKPNEPQVHPQFATPSPSVNHHEAESEAAYAKAA